MSNKTYHIILCPRINIMFVQDLKGNYDNNTLNTAYM